MREIIFRGKRLDNGEWTEGTPFFGSHDSCKMIVACALHPDFVDEGNVYYCEGFSVDHATVGQYTGMTDKNGERIFEGDILQNALGTKGRVSWYPEHAAFMIYTPEDAVVYSLCGNDFSLVEIIGNIYDNPELLL